MEIELHAPRARDGSALAKDANIAMGAVGRTVAIPSAQLVDVSWHRAAVVAAGHEQQKVGGAPLFVVTLKTRSPDGSIRPLQFSATLATLTELVRECKGAMRQVEQEIG